MDKKGLPDTRKIILTRSEPLVNLKKLRELSGFKAYNTTLYNQNRYHSHFGASQQRVVHPPSSTRNKLTIVSPKRRVRIPAKPQVPLKDVLRLRTRADGESNCSTDEERIRIPGDGCYSETDSSDNEDDLESDTSTFVNDVDSIVQDKSFLCESNTADSEDTETINNNEDDDAKDDIQSDLYEDDVIDYETESSSTSGKDSTNVSDEEESLSSLNSACSLRLKFSKCSMKEDSPLPLLKSLFSNKPPTLYFTIAEEQENSDWLGVWGKHMKPPAFKGIDVFQKINHFPGTFHIGRKDKLWRNFCKMKIAYGKQDFNFVPQTYVLPHDLGQLKKVWEEGSTKNKWIIKPPASARGSGIKVINKWSQVPKKRPVVVQRYLAKPYLINGHKFDLRIYVYVTSFDPLRIYIFEDGLVRFATSKYSSSSKSLSNRYMHLTNYSVNKNNTSVYQSNNDNLEDSKTSYKWSLKELWKYFQNIGISSDRIWESIKDVAIKSILCGEANINTLIKQNISNRLSCHELFGLDIILDTKLKPWLLEVNISPSLHSNSDLDKKIKGQLVKDILNMTGFFLPRSLLINNSGRTSNIDEIAAERFWFEQRTLSSDEKTKHTFYVQRHEDLRTRCTILDILTPDDVMIIMETEDEFSRSGSFERLMPTSEQKNYLQFMQTPRYYNLLLDEWTKQYMRDAVRSGIGISLIQSLAEAGVHLSDSVSVHPRHQWLQGGSRNYLNRPMFSAFPSLNHRRKKSPQISPSLYSSRSSHNKHPGSGKKETTSSKTATRKGASR
eukprot:TCONS_00021186-protein